MWQVMKIKVYWQKRGSFTISKTETTIKLENEIYKTTKKQGVFGCFEVTIGWYGKERVDYMTYDTNGIWRCYEIKISKSDFHSNCHNTFVGNFNYYVMPMELYSQVSSEIPNDIGVYSDGNLVKRPKKRTLQVDEQILKNSMIRSLSRDVDKSIKCNDTDYMKRLKRDVSLARKDEKYYKEKYNGIVAKSIQKLGREYVRNNLL